jgi:ribosome-associated toxin RatA of RatAB toxin-antitoxin module
MRLTAGLQPLFAFCALLTLIASASVAAATISVSKHNDTYTVNANAEVHAAPEIVWEVLTDFEHFAQFVPDMRLSRVVSGSGNNMVVEQQGIANMLFFHRRINAVMAVDLQPQTAITFRALSGNLRLMTGSWNIKPTSTGCRIDYASVSIPDFWTPPFIASLLVRSQVTTQINGVIAEINRRAHLVATTSTAPGLTSDGDRQ